MSRRPRSRLAHVAAALAPGKDELIFGPVPTAASARSTDDKNRWANFAAPAIDVHASTVDAVGAGNPLCRLARGEIPAIILRNTLSTESCQTILQRCYEQDQFPASFLPFLHGIDTSAKRAKSVDLEPLLSSRMTDGGKGGKTVMLPTRDAVGNLANDVVAARADEASSRSDIGYSLGTGGNHQATYYSKCAAVRHLYSQLLQGLAPNNDPLNLMYDSLATLCGRTKRVSVAHEHDGRQYAPAIIRIHKPETGNGLGHTYHPHYDSVRLREQRKGFEVFKYDTQLAGVLVLQAPQRVAVPNTDTGDKYFDSILYNFPASELPSRRLTQSAQLGLDVLENGGPTSGMDVHGPSWRKFCENHPVAVETTELNTGDMYFFKTDNVHEAPGFGGDRCRVVFCTFVGYSESEDEIMVWS